MNTKTFKKRVEPLITKLESIIKKMPYRGDKMTDSQKVCLLDALNRFSYNVNGIEDLDFEPLKEDD